MNDLWRYRINENTWELRSGNTVTNCSASLTTPGSTFNYAYPACGTRAAAWLDPVEFRSHFAGGRTADGATSQTVRYFDNDPPSWYLYSDSGDLTPRDTVGTTTDTSGRSWIFGGVGTSASGASSGKNLAGSDPINLTFLTF